MTLRMHLWRARRHCTGSRAYLSSKPDFSAKKDEKYFDHGGLEALTYSWWESSGLFSPKKDRINGGGGSGKKPFVVPMPPPNVTGYLHMGHALFTALQDVVVRFHRMRGRETLWLPGTDHAGIATQLLVEKGLAASGGATRQELGRDAFIEKVWDWKREKGGGITGQLRRLGASADWTRERFTLEEDMSNAVTEAFVRLYEKGLIYRGDYMVNWSPALQTAVSDLEVDYCEEPGFMYYFKYYLVPLDERIISIGNNNSESANCNNGVIDGHDKQEFMIIATTRLETIFGDTALCVHPDDPRYSHLIGRKAIVPGTSRLIPIIGDTYVDPEFGSGALKITPAHDVNDYNIGRAHSLECITIIEKNGTMNDNAGPVYAGLCRFECRKRVWEAMVADGTAVKKELIESMRVPRSQRGGEIIEPLLSTQWFVRTESMRHKAMAAVADGQIAIQPNRFEKIWRSWLEVDRDWCISRQLWWGHRIPVYYLEGGGPQDFVVARSISKALILARERWGENAEVVQDEDVLDTWFSSGLWPFATVGWPQAESDAALEEEYRRYYPASLLETGYDILFFWVARMVMLGMELTGKPPFETVYMHGLVKDQHGQKMSKTKGNVIDPVLSIDAHGCDALRMALLSATTPGVDISLSEGKIEASRNLVNKMWNIGKYVIHARDLVYPDGRAGTGKPTMRDLPLLEKYIVSRAHQVSVAVTEALGDYRYAEASREASDFLWNELADWFIEASKSRLKPDLLSSEGADDVNIDGRAVALPSSEVSMDV